MTCEESPYKDQIVAFITDIKKTAGRYDLSDDEVLKHINAGQRFLERRVQRRQQRAAVRKPLMAGAVGVTFSSNCRSIERAYMQDDCKTCQLVHVSWKHMRAHVKNWTTPVGPISAWPVYYTEAIVRLYPGDITVDELQGVFNTSDFSLGPTGSCNGIVIWPPVPNGLTVEVIGNFYDDILTLDWPFSWWLINHEDLVKKAALREIEFYMRNKQGVRDYEEGILEDLRQVDFDMAEQDAMHINRIKK